MRVFASRHLRDDGLFDCYLVLRAGDRLDPRVAEHLADCPACAARLAEVTRFMDGLRDEAAAEADEMFPESHLVRQQQQIARRLEAVGRSARILPFPAHAGPRQLPEPRTRVMPRWVAGAAAAGLFLGVAAGMFFKDSRPQMALVSPAVIAPLPAAETPLTILAPEPDREDALLVEIEAAVDRPRTAELAAFDALTPHVREVSLSYPLR